MSIAPLLPHFLAVFSFLLGVCLISQLLKDRKAPGSTWAWILSMILIPYIGVPLYLIFGGRKIKRKTSQKQDLYSRVPAEKIPMSLPEQERVLLSAGIPAKTSDNQVGILNTGEQAYAEVIKAIQGAKKSISITTFILGRDLVGREILAILTAQAEKGIQVRLLLDGLGSFWISRFMLWKLKKAGGQIAFFLPLIHIPFLGHSNLRNHRKLVLVDDQIAIAGGMNLANEYMGPEPDPKRWVDLSVRIEGSAIKNLVALFNSDWNFASTQKVPSEIPEQQLHTKRGTAILQVIGSGPDVSADPLYDSILTEIFMAKKRIWIATPYFIPDDTLSKALELAGRRGVDVRLIIPKKSNHFFADLCRGSYLRQIDRAGCQIYYYRGKMMHAKVILFDETYALVGSANMDMRSLLLNYELGIFLHSTDEIQEIAHWFGSLQRLCKRAQLKKYPFSDFLDGIGRILGPIL